MLRIDRHAMAVYRLPYRRPVRWFNSTESAGTFVALRLQADGIDGLADVAIKPTWSGLSPRALTAVVEDLYLPALSRTDVTDATAVQTALALFPGNHVAKALVVNACHMLAASAAGVPLWRSFGGQAKVDVSWCATRQSPSEMARECSEMVARHGFRMLKVKGGQGFETDRAALLAIRAALGESVDVMVDANGAYVMAELRDYLRLLADEGVLVAEDPVPLAPNATLERLVADSPLPVLVDSPCIGLADARAFLAFGAKALSVKPGRIGLTEARAIQAEASAAGAGTCAGMYAESPLGTLISLQFSAALPNPLLPAEQSFFLLMQADGMEDLLRVENGAVHLADSADQGLPGLWSQLSRFAP